MSFNSAMNIANNGLNVHANAIKITSHNVANISTPSFKASAPSFKELISAVEGTTPVAGSGQGAGLSTPTKSFERGSALADGIPTHLAMQSDGFFVMQGKLSGQTGQFYTRDGSFYIDKEGNLVNSEGLSVQGYNTDANGVTGTRVGDLIVPKGTLSAPKATANATLAANLDGRAPAMTFSATTPSTTSLCETNLTFYDSLGAAHTATVYFTPRGAQAAPAVAPAAAVTYDITYDYNIMTPAADLRTGQANPIASGRLYFDNNGRLQVVNDPNTNTATFSVNFDKAATGQSITMDFGDPLTLGGISTGQAGITAYADGTSIQKADYDGYAQGQLRDVAINQQGLITGAFSNGNRRTLGQVATASFACNDALDAVGENLYVDTQGSGLPAISGGLSTMEAGALEQSNVDLGEELIKALGYERGYQVNARTIQTVNTMYAELIRLGQ